MINTIPKEIQLEGEHISLRLVCVADANDEYVGWLNDEEVNQYLESRFIKHTISSTRAYIEKVLKDPDTIFLAIIRKDTDKHIGNIKIGPINWQHKFGDIGIMIGDRASWGKGYAPEAIKLLSIFAQEILKLNKATAGAYGNNIGSIKAFLKAGFVEEGRRKDHFLCGASYVDSVLLAKFLS